MSDHAFIAYQLQPPLLDLVPAGPRRAWMDAVPGDNAYRCLPMLIANQSGWVVLNRGTVTATWNGGIHRGDCRIETEGCEDLPLSHFGSGVITWRIPYLFRTPPGWNLLIRGPANLPKDGASSLEGVVETDWAVAPAFHSWKITRPHHPVTWHDGEPICMVVPQRRGELEGWRPELRDVFDDPDLADEYLVFSASRTEFNRTRPGSEWQKDYFLGRSPGAARAPGGAHQTRLHLRSFRSEDVLSMFPGAPAGPPDATEGTEP